MNRFGIHVTLLVALWVQGCHSEGHHTQEPVKFPVTHPLRKSTELTKEYVARMRAIQHVEVRAIRQNVSQNGVYLAPA